MFLFIFLSFYIALNQGFLDFSNELFTVTSFFAQHIQGKKPLFHHRGFLHILNVRNRGPGQILKTGLISAVRSVQFSFWWVWQAANRGHCLFCW
jgi:hypothetical protein